MLALEVLIVLPPGVVCAFGKESLIPIGCEGGWSPEFVWTRGQKILPVIGMKLQSLAHQIIKLGFLYSRA